MKYAVYVDGQEGTTGLRINEYLAQRADIEVLRIDADKRKDAAERARLLNAADVAFLCLPDAASREAASGRHRKATSAAFSRRARSAASLRLSASMRSTSMSARWARYSLMRRPVVPSCPSTYTAYFIAAPAKSAASGTLPKKARSIRPTDVDTRHSAE